MIQSSSNLIIHPRRQLSSSIEAVRPATILIIDDTPDNLRLLVATLTQQGYEVSIATSGTMALAHIEDIMPDLILLDIRMPEMNGYQVCEKLKANLLVCNIPVLFISAVQEVLDKVRVFEIGGADYITKPIQLEETLARIENQLRVRNLQKQLEERTVRLQQEVEQRRRTEKSLERLNVDLEERVQERTAQLELAYNFAATLQRITDRVRDSLDEGQILQTAVQELAQALGTRSCHAALYNLNQQTSNICYEYTTSSTLLQGQVLQMNHFSDGYNQLLQGQHFQFCSLKPNYLQEQAAFLICPLVEDQAAVGDICLVDEHERVFSEQDIWLVQQIANQCAIALRQSRFYQAVQAQVEELEQLNRLKDDFLSTVSHELRTPMANIRLATQMLEVSLRRSNILGEESSSKYLQILYEECQREILLINNLLDLSRLDAGAEPLSLTTASLQDWIPTTTAVFAERVRSQQQSLQFEITPDLPPITIDFAYLGQILTELLHNGCKYTPAGETILVSAQAESASTALLFPTSSLLISVRNSGVEIPASELAKIFDKFYRIPNNDPWRHGGTGLGLALVKKRVEQLNGIITVTSSNNWTTFTVQIPCSMSP